MLFGSMARTAFLMRMCNELEEGYVRAMKDDFQKLISGARAITGDDGYSYGGMSFYPGMVVYAQLKPVKALPDSLADKHLQWAEEYRNFDRNRQRLKQGLTTVGLRAASWQDIRDMYPDALLRPYLQEEEMKGLPRLRPDLYLDAPRMPNQTDDEMQKLREARILSWPKDQLDRYAAIGPIANLFAGYRLL